jgi:predicted acylesterase/phospholipase RssA
VKCAFVCSGGGLKAYAFHLGALRALEEAGFRRTSAADPREPAVADDLDLKIQSYIGSSAGACVAAACIYFQTMEEAEGVIGLKKSTHPRFRPRTLFRPNLSFLSNRTGVFDASAVERYFREQKYRDRSNKSVPVFAPDLSRYLRPCMCLSPSSKSVSISRPVSIQFYRF